MFEAHLHEQLSTIQLGLTHALMTTARPPPGMTTAIRGFQKVPLEVPVRVAHLNATALVEAASKSRARVELCSAAERLQLAFELDAATLPQPAVPLQGPFPSLPSLSSLPSILPNDAVGSSPSPSPFQRRLHQRRHRLRLPISQAGSYACEG